MSYYILQLNHKLTCNYPEDRHSSVQVVKVWSWQLCRRSILGLPEEVLTAEESAVTRKALVSQRTATLAALDTLGVPHAVENVQQEPVKNRTIATGAQQQHPGASGCVVGGGDGGAGVDGSGVSTTRLHPVTDRQPAHLLLRALHTIANKNN